jgi:hypothetical protein
MTVPGSYANGFAPRDGQPLHPELWRGCIGAWAPSLGPTGLTLRDWSGRGNHGTLTNGPSFAVDGGKYAITLDGSNDTVLAGSIPSLSQGTWSCWFKPITQKNDAGILATSQVLTGGARNGLWLYWRDASANNITAGVVVAGTRYLATHSVTLSPGTWYFVYGTYSGANVTCGVYGLGSTSAAGPSTTITHEAGFSIGFRDFQSVNASVDGVMIHNRVLSQNELLLLALRRGIAYELAPRRRSRIFAGGFKAYWAARKAQIIGGGL